MADLTKLIERDPNLPTASYQLAVSLLNIIKAEGKSEDQPPVFYHFARAVAYTGPNELSASQKQGIENYLTKAYTAYYGSTQGLQLLLATARDNAFLPR